MEFLDLIEKDPETADARSRSRTTPSCGGFEGAEVIMWLVMRGALYERVRKVHQAYYLPSMTAICDRDLRKRIR